MVALTRNLEQDGPRLEPAASDRERPVAAPPPWGWPEELDSEALTHLLVERWVFRTSLMILVGVLAVLAVVVAQRRAEDPWALPLAAALVVLGTIALVLFQWLRWQDRRLLAELRRRQDKG